MQIKALPSNIGRDARIMIFIDGENLAIRYGNMLDDNKPPQHVTYEKDIYVWEQELQPVNRNVIRKYYYTSLTADQERITEIEEKLKSLGIEQPRVFKKTRTRGSKQVDISLATDMLTHAHRKNYDVAILVAGDQDYIPLVDAVMGEGARVVLWFVNDGLSPALKRKADFYFDLGFILLEYDEGQWNFKIHHSTFWG
jgi:uncharacterized LabA/DUF88 family protein